ncbi:hypothetical protein D9611_013098 [Ephemerocybe angulata]|uniref:F-box domain-containing protein n=1 Tax=Ephemerocybe angulata TaxID=980116 RepID=A0A8H5BXJ3_9AGAR|nr:hypothetical protein D9611_013098 [Tulosesus angulatus]
MPSANFHFLELPVELHLEILSELEPHEITHLSQTCKALRAVCSIRQVWEAALKKICQVNGIFEPSYYPMESMDLQDLRRSALQPWRWKERCLGAAHSDSATDATQVQEANASTDVVLHCDLSAAIGTSDYLFSFHRVYLVPGGRYVFGVAGHSIHRKVICIWDLGPARPLQPFTTQGLYPFLVKEFGWQIDDEVSEPVIYGQCLRYVVRSTTARDGSRDTEATFQVFQVGPLPEDPRVRKIAEFAPGVPIMSDEVVRHWIDGDRVYIHISDSVFIWDFRRSLIATCVLSLLANNAPGGSLYQFTATGDRLIVCSSSVIWVWCTPPFEKLVLPLTLPVNDLEPMLRVPLSNLYTAADHTRLWSYLVLPEQRTSSCIRPAPSIEFDLVYIPDSHDPEATPQILVHRYALNFSLAYWGQNPLALVSKFSPPSDFPPIPLYDGRPRDFRYSVKQISSSLGGRSTAVVYSSPRMSMPTAICLLHTSTKSPVTSDGTRRWQHTTSKTAHVVRTTSSYDALSGRLAYICTNRNCGWEHGASTEKLSSVHIINTV